MNSKQRKTLAKVFDDPIRSDVKWYDLEQLIVGLGGTVEQGAGSRVGVELNGVPSVFHRPHPQKETDKGVLKSFKKFLISVGVTNAKI